MYEKVYENPDIYNIYVPLPNSPLRNLNCYVIKTPERNLIIDTGYNRPECYEALKEGLDQLEIDINKTDMFITHMHADHTGLVSSIMNEDSKIYMSKTDYGYLIRPKGTYWVERDKTFLLEGFLEEQLAEQIKINPAKIHGPANLFNARTFEDKFKFNIGKYEFTCIITPGHTPGHACLYMEKEKIMFLGDHVLYDITPNITSWHGVDNSLLDYLNSLNTIRGYEIKTAFPAHRKNEKDIYVRIDELIHHHGVRIENTMDVIKTEQGLTAYDIASKMQWSMRGKSWSEFPIQQRWFAVGETLAHLDYLLEENKIYKKLMDGVYRYYLSM